MIITNNDLFYAFNKKNDFYLRNVHLYLNRIYYSILFSEDEKNTVFEDHFNEFRGVESVWIKYEKEYCLKAYDCDREVLNSSIVESALKAHPVFQHPLFDYLCGEINLNYLKDFILNESILNLEFFDYLALSIVGVSDQAKSEIISNLWDEAGRGNIQLFHTTLFRKLMEGLELKYKRDNIIESMCWEGLAGINLFSYFSLYAYNKTKYFGLLAATEMLDPPHYNKLIKGLSKLIHAHKIDCSYYVEHETIDVEHARGWLEKVIIPKLAQNPHKNQDFWLGFYMRLDSAKRYYDRLLDLFLTQQAA